MSEWDPVISEWLIDAGCCYAGALANAEDGVMYAAAAAEGLEAWSEVYKEDYEIDTYDEEGNVSGKKAMNEATTIKAAIDEGRSPDGVWIGGIKYKVVNLQKDFSYNDSTYDCCFIARPKGGGHLIKTSGGTIVIALFDEEKEQTSGNSRTAALAFAEYLFQSGY